MAGRRKATAAADTPIPPVPDWLVKFLVADWWRRLEAARRVASERRMELDSDFHRIRALDDFRSLNARCDRIAKAVERTISAAVAYRRRECETRRRAVVRADIALIRLGDSVPEHEGVELATLVDEACRASDPIRLAVVVEKIEYRMHGLIGRAASRFSTYYWKEKTRPAKQRGSGLTNKKRRERQPDKIADAKAEAAKVLAQGLTVSDALDAVVEHTGWSREYARQAIGGVRVLAPAPKRRRRQASHADRAQPACA